MNCQSAVAWLASTRPRPSRSPPAPTTTRGPDRSDSTPHRNEPIPSVTQLSSATAEMSVRLHPVAPWIGARKTPSERIVPSERPTTKTAAASSTQRLTVRASVTATVYSAPVASEGAGGGEELLVRREPVEPLQAVPRALDIGPADDTVPVEQELGDELHLVFLLLGSLVASVDPLLP